MYEREGTHPDFWKTTLGQSNLPRLRAFNRFFDNFDFGLKSGFWTGSAVYNASKVFSKQIPNLNTRFDTWSEKRTMPRSQMKAGLSGTERPYDAQYVSDYRNQRSTFGRKKRYGLSKVVRMLKEDDCTIKSRFHHFQNLGFENGLGGRQLSYQPPKTTSSYGLLPFLLYDVTSLPGAAFGKNNSTGKVPTREYQLAYVSTNTFAGEVQNFGWLPRITQQNGCGHMYDPQNQVMDSKAVAATVEERGSLENKTLFGTSGTGAYVPYAAGFIHDWSDIQMVMYPQSILPTKWHVALVSFPDNLINDNGDEGMMSAGPSQHYCTLNGGVFNEGDIMDPSSCYDIRRTIADNTEDSNNLDNRWQKFWSGKLHNPINRDISAAGTFNPTNNRLPFKIIKHESFLQPPRDSADFSGPGAGSGFAAKHCQRLIKKLFYRRDWEFRPSHSQLSYLTGDAMNNYYSLQTRREENGDLSSPFASPSETVYLAIWCEHYKTLPLNDTLADQEKVHPKYPTNADLPSFDLMVRMQHSIRRKHNAIPDFVTRPDNPEIPEGADEPEPQDAPVKKKRSKKNGIPDADNVGSGPDRND